MRKLILLCILTVALSANQSLTESKYADSILKIWAQEKASTGEAIMTFMVNPKTGFIDRWITYKKSNNQEFAFSVKKFLSKIAHMQISKPSDSYDPVLVHVVLTGRNNI